MRPGPPVHNTPGTRAQDPPRLAVWPHALGPRPPAHSFPSSQGGLTPHIAPGPAHSVPRLPGPAPCRAPRTSGPPRAAPSPAPTPVPCALRPGLPGPARPGAQRPRRRPSGARAGRCTARGRAGRLPARLPVVPAPRRRRRRRPAPLARSPRPRAAAAHGFHLARAAMAAQCCCCKGPGAEAAPARPPPEPPPALDVASASSAQLFRLRHLQLGLELRPEARELAGCLVLELCALRPAPRALVLDAHPALRLHSAAFRRAPAAAAEPPCAFAFAAAEPGPAPPPPLPAFPEAPGAEPACCPLAFRVDPFTDYGSSLTVTLPPELQAHQPFQVILRYTSTDAPAVSPPGLWAGLRAVSGQPLPALRGEGAVSWALRLGHLHRGRDQAGPGESVASGLALLHLALESCSGALSDFQRMPGKFLGALDTVRVLVLASGWWGQGTAYHQWRPLPSVAQGLSQPGEEDSFRWVQASPYICRSLALGQANGWCQMWKGLSVT